MYRTLVILMAVLLTACGGGPISTPHVPVKEFTGWWVLTAQNPAELPDGWPATMRVLSQRTMLIVPAEIAGAWNEVSSPTDQDKTDLRIRPRGYGAPPPGAAVYDADRTFRYGDKYEGPRVPLAVFTYYQDADVDTVLFNLPVPPVPKPGTVASDVLLVVYSAVKE